MDSKQQPDCILLLSGGIDSTTVLADLVEQGKRPLCLIFDYGQTLQKEVKIAADNATRYGCQWETYFTPMPWAMDTCALLDDGEEVDRIPNGRTVEQIEEGGTPDTYVPFRNGIFLAYAVAMSEARGIEHIYCGGNGLNSGNYYDDTTAFARMFQMAADEGTSPDYHPAIIYPYADMPKSAIVEIGRGLGVDYGQTWSCYRNGEKPCGTCDSCAQRQHAFHNAGLPRN